MKLLVALLGALGLALAAAPAAAQVNHRQDHQRERIAQGWHSGELTAAEAARLERQQVRILRAETRMRADGGGLNRFERERLDERQDRASRMIYGRKHNARDR